MAEIVELNKVTDELFHLQKHGLTPGYKIGFPSLDELYSVKPGRTTIIYGIPTSGKTQFHIQLLTSLTCKHNKKHLIYTPETGSAAEIYAEIIHCLTGKPFSLSSLNRITEKELYKVIPFVQDYFKVIDVEDEGLKFDEWIELTNMAVKDYGIFTSSIDNWNDIEHDMEGGIISEYLKKQLPKFNRNARNHKTHNFIIAHSKNPVMMDKNQEFPKAPRVDEIEGGSLWYAKAVNLICIHREGEERTDGWHQSTEAQIIIRKMKKRVEGRKGTALLTFDPFRNCYYENKGERIYLETPFNNMAEIKDEVQAKAPW